MKSESNAIFSVLLVSAIAFAVPVYAAGDATAAPEKSTPSEFSLGEIKKIDLDTGKVTLKHGPIQNLGMPGMTMVFKLSSVALAKGLKPGDTVRFRADQINGAFVVTELADQK